MRTDNLRELSIGERIELDDIVQSDCGEWNRRVTQVDSAKAYVKISAVFTPISDRCYTGKPKVFRK